MNRVVAGLAIMLLLAGCGERIDPGRTEAERPVIKGLKTAIVEESGSTARRYLSGTIVSMDRAVMKARIAGQLARPLVQEGDIVKQGQPLLQLTAETATAQLKAIRAVTMAAQRQAAEAGMHAELATKNHARFAALFEKGAITALEYDRVVTEKNTTRERLAAAEANLGESLARQEMAATMADLAVLKAPFDATVIEILVDSGTTVLPGTPLLRLDRRGPWQIETQIPEGVASRYRVGDEFPVEIPALDEKATARLVEIVPAADPTTRSVTAKLALDEAGPLRGGLYVKVGLPSQGGETRLTVPLSAVVVRGQLSSVYVVENQTLKYRLVRTGPADAERVQILAGLQAGEVIVVDNLDMARHGARLEPVQ